MVIVGSHGRGTLDLSNYVTYRLHTHECVYLVGVESEPCLEEHYRHTTGAPVFLATEVCPLLFIL